MAVTTPSTMIPPPTCENYKIKSAFWGIVDPAVTLAFDLLTPKFDAFILDPVSNESLIKFRQQMGKISC